MPGPRMDHQHLAPVFRGMGYPARARQLMTRADYYGTPSPPESRHPVGRSDQPQR